MILCMILCAIRFVMFLFIYMTHTYMPCAHIIHTDVYICVYNAFKTHLKTLLLHASFIFDVLDISRLLGFL